MAAKPITMLKMYYPMTIGRFRIAFTANGKRKIRFYVFLTENEYIDENSAK